MAEVATLDPVADTALFELAPTNNLGSVTNLPAGTINQGRRSRLLVRFDPAAVLPAGAQVTAATLHLTVQRGSGPGSVFALHPMLAAWNEGSRGSEGTTGEPALPGDVTWERRIHPDVPWVAAGGDAGTDYAAEPSATLDINEPGPYAVVSTPALVADVQGWVDHPETNHGWMLLTQNEATAGTSRRVASREQPDAGPRLVVEFAASSPQPRFDGIALVGNEIQLRFGVEAGKLYVVEHSPSLSAPNWNVLAYAASKFHPTNWVMTDAWVEGPGRSYRLAVIGDVD